MTERTPSPFMPEPTVATSTRTSEIVTRSPHELECLIQRSLQAHPGLQFSRLTVHQCPQGVCLEGLLESNDNGVDLSELVNTIAGVQAINHVVTRLKTPK